MDEEITILHWHWSTEAESYEHSSVIANVQAALDAIDILTTPLTAA